jgi:hypothetical protein
MLDPATFGAVEDDGEVVLYLAAEDGDGAVPRRSIYWFGPAPMPGGWWVRIPAAEFARWCGDAVAAEFPGGDKRAWRLATRWAVFRFRTDPPALGVSSPVLGERVFERLTAEEG